MGVGSSFDSGYEEQPSVSSGLGVAHAQQAPAPLGHSVSHYNGNADRASGSRAGAPTHWTGTQGSLWSGPTTALTPVPSDDAHYVPRDEAPQWPLPHDNPLFPATSTMRMLRGARSIDSTRARLGEPPSGFVSSRVRTAAEDLSPMRPTRAGLESENAGLSASVGAARALEDLLAKKVRGMREALRSGDFSYGVGEGCNDAVFGSSHLGLQAYRVQAVSLEAELDIYRDKVRAHMSVCERQRKEMTTLRRDCAAQAQRAATAQQDRAEAREQLKKSQQEHAELSRKAKTEQIRVEMLRDAFEQEQTRVGESLGRAEMFVSDLVAATEGTHRVEVEEQWKARECVSALTEIHAAEARDELLAEATCRNLRRELNVAEAALSAANAREKVHGSSDAHGDVDADAVAATAAYASVQSERYAAVNKFADAKRKYHEATLIAKRCLAQEEQLRRDTEALRHESGAIAKETIKGKGTRAMRMQFEETAEAALRNYEAKIAGIVAMAEKEGLELRPEARRALSPIGESARQCLSSFGTELELVRSELQETRAVSVPRASSLPPQAADWQLDLQAAGMQRKLGKVLAAEREKYCQLVEARVQAGEVLPQEPKVPSRRAGNGNTESVMMLQEQVEVLRNELHLKDVEINRLSSTSSSLRPSSSAGIPGLR